MANPKTPGAGGRYSRDPKTGKLTQIGGPRMAAAATKQPAPAQSVAAAPAAQPAAAPVAPVAPVQAAPQPAPAAPAADAPDQKGK